MLKLKKLAMALLPLNMVAMAVHADISKSRLTLQSPGLSFVKEATYLKPVKPNTTMHVTVWLKLRHEKQLDQLVHDVYDPNSSRYQKFMTPEEYKETFAPSAQVEESVRRYFIAQGMQAEIINHSVKVTASVQQIEKTFKTQINTYRFQNQTVFANASAPTLSADIARHVLEVTGLSNIVQYKSHSLRAPAPHPQQKPDKVHDINMIWDSFIPSAVPTNQSTIAGITGANLITTYQFNKVPAVNGTTINGSGQTIVILDGCDTNSATQILSDANAYNTANGLPPYVTTGASKNFAILNPDGTQYTTCGSNPKPGSWNIEIAIDLESSHTVAPNANVVLVLSSPGDGSVLDADLATIIASLIANQFTIDGFSNAYILSNSWGGDEPGAYSEALESSLKTAAAAGMSLNFSSGDCGDYTYTSPNGSGGTCAHNGQTHSVAYPASSQYVTGLGGTSLFVDNTWAYAFESGWGTYNTGGFVYGATGGISQSVSNPAWQATISTYTAGGYTGTIGAYQHRAVPDIGFLADPVTGLIIYEGNTNFPGGGTSLACPLYAGILALINQERHLLGKGVIGLTAPYLYNSYSTLVAANALRLVIPPHQIISGATNPPSGAPLSAFTLTVNNVAQTFSWDSSLTVGPEHQFWNDVVGVGTPYAPSFVPTMAYM